MHGILSNLGVHLTENQEKQVGSTSNYIETTRKSKCLSIWTYDGNTVYIGFYDQPPSQGSRSLNPAVVAKLSEVFAWFNDQVVAKTNADYTPLDIATFKTVDGRYFAT